MKLASSSIFIIKNKIMFHSLFLFISFLKVMGFFEEKKWKSAYLKPNLNHSSNFLTYFWWQFWLWRHENLLVHLFLWQKIRWHFPFFYKTTKFSRIKVSKWTFIEWAKKSHVRKPRAHAGGRGGVMALP